MYRNLIKSSNSLRHSSRLTIRQLSSSSNTTTKTFPRSLYLAGTLVPSIIIYNYLQTNQEPIKNEQVEKNIHYENTSTAGLIEDTMTRANDQSEAASKAFAKKQESLKGESSGKEETSDKSSESSSGKAAGAGISSQVRTKDSGAKQAADERQEGNYTRKPNKGTRKDKQVYEQEENKPKPTKDSKTEGEGEGESEDKQEAAFNPETGEINWDCPCLGGMAHGPCGEEFKEAFSCFVFSETEPKGIDCIKKFETMRSCFKKHPDHYKEELYDDEKELDTKDVEHVVLEEASDAVKEIESKVDNKN